MPPYVTKVCGVDIEYHRDLKILLNIDNSHKLVIEVQEIGGYLIETGEICLQVFNTKYSGRNTIVLTMKRILDYCKSHLDFNKYLEVERFFMERET
jgi:hypothetical protein